MNNSLTLLLITVIVSICACERNQKISHIDNTTTIDAEKINRKILIIGIDGFRSDAMTKDITPFMYNLIQNNNIYYIS